MYYFSDTYEQGREKFLGVCKNNRLTVDSHINPHAKSFNGDDLAMDVVWCGAQDASKVLLVTCGIHGLEAATGAATILQWIDQGNTAKLPKDCAVLFVHALNPYGWAYGSRTNENNIDINRNFLDFDKPHPKNDAYKEVVELLINDEMNSETLASSINKFNSYMAINGAFKTMHAITGGQYIDPNGIGYGGIKPSWSHQTLMQIIRDKLTTANKVVSIDWHTGIGEYGQPFFISMNESHSSEYKMACNWWGNKIHNNDIFGDDVSPDYKGLLIQGLKNQIQKASNAEIISIVVEMGTYGLESMLEALLMDRWLRAGNITKEVGSIRLQRLRLIERFYPSMPEWRNSVLMHAKQIYQQAVEGLKDW